MAVLGSEFRARRRERGLSQVEMGKVFGVRRTTIIRWEAATEDLPRVVRLALAAWVYGLPALGEEGRK